MNPAPNKFQLHFFNANSLRARINELREIMPDFPHTAFVAVAEAKIAHENDTPGLKQFGFVHHAYPFTDGSSGIVSIRFIK